MANSNEEAAGRDCPRCGKRYDVAEIAAALNTCPSCGLHYRMEPAERVEYLCDKGTFAEFSGDLRSLNPIEFSAYEEKLSEASAKTGMKDAVITGCCEIHGKPAILALMSFSFMGGSMGSVVGEKICRAMLKSAQDGLPLILYATSGGARMQEGIFSLMQMAKTASVAAEMDRAGVPFFTVLCDPTTGGVTASFATLADIIIAEPGALIGFAGPRVIEGTIHAKLPEGFQRAEFQRDKGFVDLIAARKDQKRALSALLELHHRNFKDL
ncbi:MAG: acetyl-CoA carboxylase, carboxyltransferase subunit beta [Spirochaetaceae bacterium]|jgi:acetyl-CoA carboxylase carboxyl transferase subunit beta|nr:acetyl-CoA carboxylase, carboxyltransferase subunit beta [Spirochaetaceae bacterium]